MSDKATFEIHGTLTRVKVHPKCAFLTVETREQVRGKERVTKHDLVTFDRTMNTDMEGERVIATGRLDRTMLKNTKRHSDNGLEYDVWAASLVCVALRPDNGTGRVPAQTSNTRDSGASGNVPGGDLEDDLQF